MARKKQETLVLFPEVITITRKFSDEQFGFLMRAIFSYRFGGEIYSGDDVAVDVAFQTITGQIDRYQEYCNTLSNNAKGEQSTAKVSKTQQSTAKVNKTQQSDPPYPYPNPYPDPYPISISNEGIEADKPREDFEKFWSAYPKKVGKKSAKKAFSRAEEPVETLLTAIERQKCSAQWSKDNGQYIPNPATWLNQGRWDDELDSPDPEQEYTLASLEDPWEVAMRGAGGYV